MVFTYSRKAIYVDEVAGAFASMTVLAIVLLISTLPVEEMLEVRELFAIYGDKYYYVVQHQTSLYLWRSSTMMLVVWFFSLITYMLKPTRFTSFHMACNGIAFAALHYLHIATIRHIMIARGMSFAIYPFVYNVNGLYFIDVGQIVLAYSAYRMYMHVRARAS